MPTSSGSARKRSTSNELDDKNSKRSRESIEQEGRDFFTNNAADEQENEKKPAARLLSKTSTVLAQLDSNALSKTVPSHAPLAAAPSTPNAAAMRPAAAAATSRTTHLLATSTADPKNKSYVSVLKIYKVVSDAATNNKSGLYNWSKDGTSIVISSVKAFNKAKAQKDFGYAQTSTMNHQFERLGFAVQEHTKFIIGMVKHSQSIPRP